MIRTRHAAALGGLLLFVASASAQVTFPVPSSPPPRPRLLFTGGEIPALQAKIAAGGPAASAWALTSRSGSWQWPGALEYWRIDRQIRYMTERAARYHIEGNVSAGQAAKANFLQAMQTYDPDDILRNLPRGSSTVYNYKPFRQGAMAAGFAVAYDLIRPLMSSSERASAVAFLLRWVRNLPMGSIPTGSFSSYAGCTDNWTFSIHGGMAMCLLAVWGDTNRPGIEQEIQGHLLAIRDGYLDVISPDGSYDEGPGYATYGVCWAVRVFRAAERCGFGDMVAGTNIERMPRWFGTLIMGDQFPWIADSDNDHVGVNVDPVLYDVVGRLGDGEGLWALNRVFAHQSSTSWGLSENGEGLSFSPYLSYFLAYPEGLAEEPPAVLSAFYRDNENRAPTGNPSWNKFNNNSSLGFGGAAILHNEPHATAFEFSLYYNIRDEWMNHAHEDDGHISLMAGGRHLFLDLGYAGDSSQGFVGGQNVDHNIVTFNGRGFGGSNYYSPPSPAGRFLGRREAMLLGAGGDYVRGAHEYMWGMPKADRSVVLMKDEQEPIAILYDVVDAQSGWGTYEQVWHCAASMTGDGTASSPFRVRTSTAATAWGVYFQDNALVTRVTDSSSRTAPSGVLYRRTRLRQSSSGQVEFFGLWSPIEPTSQAPLTAPDPRTKGGVVTFGTNRIDRFLASRDGTGFDDTVTTSDGRLGYVRSDATGAVRAYMVAEATWMWHGADRLLDSSEPVTAVVNGARVDITRALSRQGSANVPDVILEIPAGLPQGVQEVYLDGALVPHIVQGSRVAIGAASLPPFTRDRHYPFEDGAQVDGVLAGGAELVNGKLGARNTTGTYEALAGDAYTGGRLWIGVDVDAVNAQVGQSGRLVLRYPNGQEHMDVGFWVQPGTGLYAFVSGAQVPVPQGFTLAPDAPGGTETRIAFDIDFAQGSYTVFDRMGNLVGSGVFVPTNQPVQPLLEVVPGGLFDDFTVMDDEEAPGVPQGIAIWMRGNGRMGWHVSAPSIMNLQSWSLEINGYQLNTTELVTWLAQGVFVEDQISPYLGTGPVPVGTIRELTLKSQIPQWSVLPGIDHVLNVTTLRRDALTEGARLQ